MKKIFKLSFKEKYFAIAAVLFLAVLVLPLLRLAMFTLPFGDDYYFSREAMVSWRQYHSIGLVIKAALTQVQTTYYQWQGSFSSIFLMSLSTAIFKDTYYMFGVMFIIVSLTVSSFLMCTVIGKNVLKMSKSQSVILAVIVAASMIELIYSAQPGFFWYNSAVHYTLAQCFMFLMIAAVVVVLYSKKLYKTIIYTILSSLFAVYCAGSNYVTCLVAFLFLLTIVALGIIFKSKNKWFLFIPSVCYAIGFYFNVSAPGNATRAANFDVDHSAIMAILHSLQAAATNFWEFTGPMMLLVLFLVIPLAWNTVIKMNFSFKFPVLVLAYSFGLYAAGFTSSFYSMGNAGISRAWVAIKLTFQLLLFVNEFYIIGYIAKKIEKKREIRHIPHFVFFYTGVAVLFCVTFFLTSNQAGTISSYGAYYYVHSGEASNFQQEALGRIEEIKNAGNSVAVNPLNWKPWFIFIQGAEITEDPTYYNNRYMANWYGKQEIYLLKEE